ncbi:MAG: DUF938 domain-containing protein [Marinobacter sp.]|uniref:DUF938 domain-containing protein n=1 Tax=Marinobacter sp. TaxID=50741 RepID=UPI0034A0056B
MQNSKPFSQACENNKQPILDVIRSVFTHPGLILEIGSGTGQHAVHFTTSLHHLTWQPSDHPSNAELCQARIQEANLPNMLPPLTLDVSSAPWPLAGFDGAFSANTAHIMGWPDVKAMFRGVAAGLKPNQSFCLYGPFCYNGVHTSESNQQFDLHLRNQAEHMGIRDVNDLEGLASAVDLTLAEDFNMPANNRLLVWRKQ